MYALNLNREGKGKLSYTSASARYPAPWMSSHPLMGAPCSSGPMPVATAKIQIQEFICLGGSGITFNIQGGFSKYVL
jgi:hypothetical protein